MALFCAAIRRESVSLFRFPFLGYVQVFSYTISLVCLLKYPYSCFSSHFCFLVIIVLLIFDLFLVSSISLSSLFFYLVSSRRIDKSTLSSTLPSLIPASFFDTYRLCHLSGANTLYLVISFLVVWSISWSSLVHFKNGPEYLTRGTARVFIPLMRFLLCSLV